MCEVLITLLAFAECWSVFDVNGPKILLSQQITSLALTLSPSPCLTYRTSR